MQPTKEYSFTNYRLTGDNISELMEWVCKIVRKTGQLMTDEAIPAIHMKGRADYVTDMDVRVQNQLVDALKDLLPHSAFILEEQDVQPSLADYTWIIDPIDGTLNYINSYQQSAICVALLHKGKGVLGIVYNPFYNEMYTAVSGKGAFLNGMPIHASQKALAESVICFGTSPYRHELHACSLETLGNLYGTCTDLRRSGSAALDMCAVACGRADGFFEYSLCPWDYAAASIIIREAGGEIACINLPEWTYTKKCGIVAACKNTFEELITIVESNYKINTKF